MAYRVYNREPVKRGSWYYGAPCEACNKPVCLFEDESNGTRPMVPFEGAISCPCRHCGGENLFPAETIRSIKAPEDLPGMHPPRAKTSKSSRKPLLRSHPKSATTFGVGFVEDRPAAAAIIGRVVTAWGDIEVQCARLLAELMQTNVAPAAAVFGSLKSSRAQGDALGAAAKAVLNDTDYELFTAHMARRAALEKERNDLAHGCYGVSVTIPDDVVWVAQADYLAFIATFQTDPDALSKFREKQFVYEVGTLERIAQEVEQFYDQLDSFRGYLVARHGGPRGAAFRAARYPQLCSQPHIRQALDQLRTAKRQSQAAQKAPHAKKRRGR